MLESALGYSLSTVDKFAEEIMRRLPDFRAIYKNTTAYGDKYEVVMLVDGIDGSKKGIITAWIYGDVSGNIIDSPRCTNVIMRKRKESRP